MAKVEAAAREGKSAGAAGVPHPHVLFDASPGASALSPAESLDAFPEALYPPSPQDQSRYQASVARGYQTMRNSTAVIAGLARNIAPTFPKTAARIERLGSLFADYRVVIYENDSSDGTEKLLADWSARNSRVKLLQEVRQDPVNQAVRCTQRASRMAYYRNQYHRYIAANFSDYDAMIVVDTDLPDGWSYDGIADTFGHTNWDFVGANGLIYRRQGFRYNATMQYDAWAFRLDDAFTPLKTRDVNLMKWARGTPLVPVTSCFGGVGVYRMEAILAASYDGPDCEHIALHRRMREKGYGRTFLNPNQLALYGRKQRSIDRRLGKLWGTLQGLVRWK